MVEPREVVSVNFDLLSRPLPLDQYYDYGCVPLTPNERQLTPEQRQSNPDPYAEKARNFLEARPCTTRLSSDNLEQLVYDLLNAEEIDHPIRDIWLVAHRNYYGDLGFPLQSNSNTYTSYEALQEVVQSQSEVFLYGRSC